MNPRLRAAREAIDAATDGLPPAAIARKPGDRWSIAEILEHLTLAFTAHAAALEKPLASGELRTRTPVFKEMVGRIVVITLGYFPRREAPQATRPSGTIAPERAVAAIREALDRLDATLDRVERRFGANVPVSNHPYFAGLSVNQWRKFHWRHVMHHMSQVRDRARA